jgi:CDP-2,3-bis-(O-geranylgeranyl)-sn-glycerol synthase
VTDIALLILQSLWFIAPAYAANGFPPLMQGKRPIDFKKNFKGKRLLGDGKTWEGTISGIVVGILVGALQVGYQSKLDYLNLGLPQMTMLLVAMLCLGTMTGDIFGSFLKRRLGMKRGQSAIILDQDGFIIVAFIFACAVYALNPLIVLTLLIITPPIHWLSNVFGYYTKFKKTPW